MIAQVLMLGLVAGILGGMFGIGGGAIMVPVMVLAFGIDQKMATGTSLLAQLLPVGMLGIGVYYKEGNLDWRKGMLLAAGLLVGNLLGAVLANQPWISPQAMRKGYGVLLLLVGARYLWL